MGAIASQITSITIDFSIVCSEADQRKCQSSASLAFVWGIHLAPVNSLHQMAINAEKNSIWWRHHGWPENMPYCCCSSWCQIKSLKPDLLERAKTKANTPIHRVRMIGIFLTMCRHSSHTNENQSTKRYIFTCRQYIHGVFEAMMIVTRILHCVVKNQSGKDLGIFYILSKHISRWVTHSISRENNEQFITNGFMILWVSHG